MQHFSVFSTGFGCLISFTFALLFIVCLKLEGCCSGRYWYILNALCDMRSLFSFFLLYSPAEQSTTRNRFLAIRKKFRPLYFANANNEWTPQHDYMYIICLFYMPYKFWWCASNFSYLCFSKVPTMANALLCTLP